MRSTIDLEKGSIRIEIEIEASPEAVFDALTDPKLHLHLDQRPGNGRARRISGTRVSELRRIHLGTQTR
jgi:uncharacterized protein YndB with AHSA1/START domain